LNLSKSEIANPFELCYRLEPHILKVNICKSLLKFKTMINFSLQMILTLTLLQWSCDFICH